MQNEWQRRGRDLTVTGAAVTAAELARQLNAAEARLAAAEAVCRSAEDVYDLLDVLRPFISPEHWPVTRAFRASLLDYRRAAREEVANADGR